MARVVGRGRPGWLWPVVILLSLLILGVIAWAILAPSAPGTLPTETAPAAAPAIIVTSVGDITADPSSFYGRNVSVGAIMNRTAGDQGVYLAGIDDSELLAVLDTSFAGTGLRQGEFASFFGTVREVNEGELAMIETTVDKATRDVLASEQYYLSVSGFQPTPSDLGF